jgi:anthranilate synthase/aminodeoxychorismate synthase-like glutamine amidotransferase
MPHILVIDNYDSFTYNLVQYLGQVGADVTVRRNDEISVQEIVDLRPDGIMLSPGPCTPDRSGICLSVLAGALGKEDPLHAGLNTSAKQFFESVPIFGVCLGHQAVGHLSGATVTRAQNIMHGKASMVKHDGKGLFEGMPNPFRAIRYHSLVITEATLPADFTVTAKSEDDGEIMGIRHKRLPIEGVQFHPESVLTENGIRIVENFVKRSTPQIT